MIPILSGNVASATAGGFEVANSCLFDRASSGYMDKSSGTSSNNDIYTISFWMKRAGLEISDNILFSIYKDGNNRAKIGIGPHDSGSARDHKLELYDWYGGSQILNQVVDVHLMDPASWYHICIRVDTTQSTANDRVRVYINGVDQASNITRTTTPNQNQNLGFQETTASNQWRIGSHNGGGDYYDGYLAEVVYCDGQSYAPTEFGEFDEDSPTIWKPKDVSGLTFGTNGFYLDFEDSSNLGNDANGGTDFNENGIAAIDQKTDTPTNNFCTLNPLAGNVTFSEGNTTWAGTTSGYEHSSSTLGVSSGKWYWEVKPTNACGCMGITDATWQFNRRGSIAYASSSQLYVYEGNGYVSHDSYGDISTSYSTYTTEIIGVALDLDNNKLHFSKGGVWEASSNPATNTNGISIQAPSTLTTGFYTPLVADLCSATTGGGNANFGCPAFSISSGNSDGNGYGNFEYAVPSGYLALCTKNLGSDGG